MLIALLAAAATALSPPSSFFTDVAPPSRYQDGGSVTLQVTDQAGIDRACHPLFGVPPAGMKTEACATGNRIVVPNPCRFDQNDRYARLLCHELAHTNGWPPSHGG